jgi:hypothetical protein
MTNLPGKTKPDPRLVFLTEQIMAQGVNFWEKVAMNRDIITFGVL